MNSDRIEGAARKVGGRIEDAAGGLMGDAATQLRGKADEVAGAAQNVYGQAVDGVKDAAGKAQDVYGQAVGGVKDFAQEQPIAVVLAAMSIGAALGFMLGRR